METDVGLAVTDAVLAVTETGAAVTETGAAVTETGADLAITETGAAVTGTCAVVMETGAALSPVKHYWAAHELERLVSQGLVSKTLVDDYRSCYLKIRSLSAYPERRAAYEARRNELRTFFTQALARLSTTTVAVPTFNVALDTHSMVATMNDRLDRMESQVSDMHVLMTEGRMTGAAAEMTSTQIRAQVRSAKAALTTAKDLEDISHHHPTLPPSLTLGSESLVFF